MKIAIAQFALQPGCDEHRMDHSTPAGVWANVETAANLIAQAAQQKIDLVAFGEWFIGLSANESVPSPLTDRFCALAREYGIILALGGLRVVASDGLRSKHICLVIGPTGDIIGQQLKLNPYRQEAPWYEVGECIQPVNFPGGKLVVTTGLDSADEKVYEQIKSIQPDLWIAQANDQLTRDVNSSTIPEQALPRLFAQRSEELGATIAVAMMLGCFREMTFYGGSLFAQRGRIIAQLGDQTGLLEAEVPLREASLR